ncbi:MAG: hypothetical protein AAF492_11020 [Verrucomicrobiota bacterium]
MATPKQTREEQAALEVGVTEIDPRLARVVTSLFVALILLVPTWQVMHELKLDPEKRQLKRALSLLPFPTVKELKKFETDLEDAATIRDAVLPPTQLMLAQGFGVGNEKVYLGRSTDWLFFRDAIDYVTAPPFLDPEVIRKKNLNRNHWQADPLKAILKMHEDLKAQGIQLVVMPMPVKPVKLPQKFTDRYPEDFSGALHNPSFEQLVESLEQRGVKVFEPFTERPASGEDYQTDYLHHDTHWTWTGMNRTAEELTSILEDEAFGLSPRQEGIYRLNHSGEPLGVVGGGDLLAMLKLPEAKAIFEYQGIWKREVVNWAADEKAEILLLGDSFSNIYSHPDLKWGERGGLAEMLSVQLQRPVDTIIQNGDGAFATRQTLHTELRRGQPRLAGKKVVIYQFACRELVVGNWKVLDFPVVEAKDVEPETKSPSGGDWVVEGRIEDFAEVPAPGTVPYEDAITSWHVSGLNPPVLTNVTECVVYLWGMKKNTLTPAARVKAGQAVKLKLTPWADVKKIFGSYTRLDVDEIYLLIDLPVYWAEEIP